MNTPRRSLTVATIMASLCFSLPVIAAEDKEEKSTLNKIPPAAAKALQAQAGSEKITDISREKDDGKTVFEATFKKAGHVHDVTVDETGKLISDEETIPASEAPAAVRTAIEKQHPGGKIEKMERITASGNVSYEALVSSPGKREEIKFDSKGKVLEREDKTGSGKKD